jgi:hypothetical protein
VFQNSLAVIMKKCMALVTQKSNQRANVYSSQDYSHCDTFVKEKVCEDYASEF